MEAIKTMTLFPELEPPRAKARKRRRRKPGRDLTPVQIVDEDDGRFLADLRRGTSTELAVAGALDRAGFSTEVGFSGWKVKDPSNQADVIVNEKLILEIKGRNFRFVGPWDYPYRTALVGNVNRWERRSILPAAVVVASEITGAKVGIWTDTMEHWVQEKHYDKHRQRETVSLAVPRRYLLKWTRFVAEMKERL